MIASLASIRHRTCDRFQVAAAILAAPAALTSAIRSQTTGWLPVMSLHLVLAGIIITVSLLRHRLPYRFNAVFSVGVMAVVGLISFLQFGLLAQGTLFFAAAAMMAAILLGCRVGAFVLGLSVAAMLAIGFWAAETSYIPSLDITSFMLAPTSWAAQIAGLIFVAGTTLYMFRAYSESLFAALSRAQTHEEKLRTTLAERQAAELAANQAHKVALVALADLAEYRDTDTGEHVLRVGRMSHEIARALLHRNYEPDVCNQAFLHHIGLAGILHDVGKVGVPDSVLLKPGRLDQDERVVMEQHASHGGEILNKAARMLNGNLHFRLAGDIAGNHHEHWDGKGYPSGKREGEIPLAARIVAVADVYDALISPRPYKQAWDIDKAVNFIRERSGTQFDPTVVEAFLTVLSQRSKISVVEWNESIAIGHAEIDQDHRILLHLINQLAIPENIHDVTAVDFVLDELINYTCFHFDREEAILADCDYQELDRHKEKHAEMLATVQDLRGRFIRQEEGIGQELYRYLSVWLVRHIMQEDRAYQPFLPAK